jgi:hypothetical protein
VGVSSAVDCLGWPIHALTIVIMIILSLPREIKLLQLLQGKFENLCAPAMLESYPLRSEAINSSTSPLKVTRNPVMSLLYTL